MVIVTSGSASSMALSVPPPSAPLEEKQLIAGTSLHRYVRLNVACSSTTFDFSISSHSIQLDVLLC